MVSGSKLKNPSKVSGDSPISLYYSLIYGNCLGNVVMGMEKCGKMCENVLETRFLYTTYSSAIYPLSLGNGTTLKCQPHPLNNLYIGYNNFKVFLAIRCINQQQSYMLIN